MNAKTTRSLSAVFMIGAVFILLALIAFTSGCGRGEARARSIDEAAAVAELDATEPQEEKAPKAHHTCGATTQKGQPCKRRVKAAGLRCYQHQGR